MAWTAPKTFLVAELVNAAMLNTHLRDNARYLKGLDGSITIDNVLTATSFAINVASPQARFHLVDSSDLPAMTLENVKNPGTPQGLITTVRANVATARALSVQRGTLLGSTTEVFNVRGDNIILSQGFPINHTPLVGVGSGVVTMSTLPQTLPGTQLVVTEPGKYFVSGQWMFNWGSAAGDTGQDVYAMLTLDAGNISNSIAVWRIPSSASDFQVVTITAYTNIPAGSHVLEARAQKSGGGGNAYASANTSAVWVAP